MMENILKTKSESKLPEKALELANEHQLGKFVVSLNDMLGKLRPTKPAYIYENGLIFESTQFLKKNYSAYRWVQVKSYVYDFKRIDEIMPPVSSFDRTGGYTYISYTYFLRLNFYNNQSLMLKYCVPHLHTQPYIDYNRGFYITRYTDKSDSFLYYLCKQMAKGQFKLLIQSFSRGMEMQFGKLKISQKGIVLEERFIPWENVYDAGFEDQLICCKHLRKEYQGGVVLVVKGLSKERKTEFLRFPAKEMANLDTMRMLMNHYKKTNSSL